MSVIIYRTLFYTFGTYVVKTIKKGHNVRVSLDEKTKRNLRLLKDTAV